LRFADEQLDAGGSRAGILARVVSIQQLPGHEQPTPAILQSPLSLTL